MVSTAWFPYLLVVDWVPQLHLITWALRISAATVFLWVSCVLAILITAGMFWLFLQNHMVGLGCNREVEESACILWGLFRCFGMAQLVSCTSLGNLEIDRNLQGTNLAGIRPDGILKFLFGLEMVDP